MEMNCEHGVSIHHDCEACASKYRSEGQTWETKQIRRELAMVDARVLELMRERQAEHKRRTDAEATLHALHVRCMEFEEGHPDWMKRIQQERQEERDRLWNEMKAHWQGDMGPAFIFVKDIDFLFKP